MRFWRPREDEAEPTESDGQASTPPGSQIESVDAGWEPDPADFDDPLRNAHPGPAGSDAEATTAAPARAAEPEMPPAATALDAGLQRTRGGFMSRLRGLLGGGETDGPSWDEVEETLIAGDVGAALAIELVERARARRDPGGPEAAIRAELAALLVSRDVGW